MEYLAKMNNLPNYHGAGPNATASAAIGLRSVLALCIINCIIIVGVEH